ncbi:hypothetical protein RJ639_034133 [Escallonia herrerae]|uniref:Integrase catalytic domain-containing protein n=1 Tax=Escallonia herrerae TaxID=1293975 RepID=A0AA88WVG4_9ASTE|nr:hypothetical protein RJ639_034133 [Escallonia herrerae]
MQKDTIEFTRRCDKCQKFAPISHTSVVPLKSIVSPIPFVVWGMDLLGPFPKASGQRRFVIVAIDYFTKWTEAESLETITSAKCEDFFWKNVICRFGVPRALVVDNGKQFDNNNFRTFCTNLSIDLRFTSVAHPQSNGQTENMNRSILRGLKKKLDEAKGAWVDELPKVLWAYRTTPHSVTGETPFLLCYGTEAMLPVEIGVPTIRSLHFHENEILQGDVRKALSKHLLGLCKAKVIDLKAIFGALLQPFVSRISIQEVADALVSRFGYLFCRFPLDSLQPLLQSRNLSKIIFLSITQLFSMMSSFLRLLKGIPLLLSFLCGHLPCHLKARKHLRSASIIGSRLARIFKILTEWIPVSIKRKLPLVQAANEETKSAKVEKMKVVMVEKLKVGMDGKLKLVVAVDWKFQLHFLKLELVPNSKMNYSLRTRKQTLKFRTCFLLKL